MSHDQATKLKPGDRVYAVWPVDLGTDVHLVERVVRTVVARLHVGGSVLLSFELHAGVHLVAGWEPTPADAWRVFLVEERARFRAAEMAAVKAGVLTKTTADVVDTAWLRSGYIAHSCKTLEEARGEARAILEVVEQLEGS